MKNIPTKSIYGDTMNPTDFRYRPRVSKKIREYIVDLIQKNILEPKKIIVADKHSYNIIFSVKPKIDDAVIPDEVLWIVRTREGIKNIAISIYHTAVTKDITAKEYTELIFNGMKVFLTEQYKKIKPEEVEEVRKKIDWEFIEGLPFPAPFKEQEYIGDTSPNIEMAYIQEFGF